MSLEGHWVALQPLWASRSWEDPYLWVPMRTCNPENFRKDRVTSSREDCIKICDKLNTEQHFRRMRGEGDKIDD